jgi:hypothetical protein
VSQLLETKPTLVTELKRAHGVAATDDTGNSLQVSLCPLLDTFIMPGAATHHDGHASRTWTDTQPPCSTVRQHPTPAVARRHQTPRSATIPSMLHGSEKFS